MEYIIRLTSEDNKEELPCFKIFHTGPAEDIEEGTILIEEGRHFIVLKKEGNTLYCKPPKSVIHIEDHTWVSFEEAQEQFVGAQREVAFIDEGGQSHPFSPQESTNYYHHLKKLSENGFTLADVVKGSWVVFGY